MGWTGIEMDGKITKKAIRETLKSELSSLDIVDVELVKNPNYIRGTDDEKYQLYAAVRDKDAKVYALIVMITWSGNELLFKIMDENMGPYAYACPKRILDKLSETGNEYAQLWRAECWKTAQNI